MDTKKLQQLIDKNEITEKILLWCRGVDRADEKLMASTYHDDAIDIHTAELACSGPEMSKLLAESSLNIQFMSHQANNILIELHGDTALAETYCLVTTSAEGSEKGLTVAGARYLDRFERRSGEWKVAHRKAVIDWHFKVPADVPGPGGFNPAKDAAFLGDKMPHDELYTLLKSVSQ